MNLDRFIEGQDCQDSGYATAVAELRRGRKSSHWIWYIFPQLAGLGHSPTARHYEIRDEAEAGDYLRHPVLRERLRTALMLAADHLERGVVLEALMGGRTDALKLVSSATLFATAAAQLFPAHEASSAREVGAQAERILHAVREQGFAPCATTLRALGRS